MEFSYIQALIIAIVEGLTEFLPISSTGHMIIASAILGVPVSDPFVKLFIVCIQLGAILSVVVFYFKRFFKSILFYQKLFIAFLPVAVIGLLLKKHIDKAFENVLIIALFLFIGGVVLLFIDKWFVKNDLDNEEKITFSKAFKIGFFQCLAIFPGVSRSGASIIGGMTQKLTRKNAAEFSFFLAVPTMFAATGLKLYAFYKEGLPLNSDKLSLLVFGNVIAFIVGIIAIKFFIEFLNKYGFKVFGWYRIIIGGAIIILYLLKIPLKVM